MSLEISRKENLQTSEPVAKEKQDSPGKSMPSSRVRPQFKILYLLTIAVGVLALRDPLLNSGLLLLQGILWGILGIQRQDLKVLKKGYPFALAILFINSFFTVPRDLALFSLFHVSVGISTQGLTAGLFLVARFFTILLASLVVRKSMTSEEFIEGLTRFKLSPNFALILDSILTSLEGKSSGGGGGKGQGRGQGQGKEAKAYSLKSILKGDFSIIIELIRKRLTEAKEKFVDYDWAVISAIAVMVVGIRMIKILPGIPIAPGHKNVLIIPLFVLVATLSKKKFAATYVGFLSGVIAFFFGFGKYGILGIGQFMIPGLIVDIMIGLSFQSQSIFIFGLIGLVAGMGRVSAEILLALVFGLPKAFYLFFTPLFLSQCGFGLISAPVSKYLLKHFPKEELERD